MSILGKLSLQLIRQEKETMLYTHVRLHHATGAGWTWSRVRLQLLSQSCSSQEVEINGASPSAAITGLVHVVTVPNGSQVQGETLCRKHADRTVHTQANSILHGQLQLALGLKRTELLSCTCTHLELPCPRTCIHFLSFRIPILRLSLLLSLCHLQNDQKKSTRSTTYEAAKQNFFCRCISTHLRIYTRVHAHTHAHLAW